MTQFSSIRVIFRCHGQGFVRFCRYAYDVPHGCPQVKLKLGKTSSSEIQTFGTIAEGLESVSLILVQCALVEQRLLSDFAIWRSQVADLLTQLYAAILNFILKAKQLFRRTLNAKTKGQGDVITDPLTMGMIEAPGSAVQQHLKKISEEKTKLDNFCTAIDGECRPYTF